MRRGVNAADFGSGPKGAEDEDILTFYFRGGVYLFTSSFFHFSPGGFFPVFFLSPRAVSFLPLSPRLALSDMSQKQNTTQITADRSTDPMGEPAAATAAAAARFDEVGVERLAARVDLDGGPSPAGGGDPAGGSDVLSAFHGGGTGRRRAGGGGGRIGAAGGGRIGAAAGRRWRGQWRLPRDGPRGGCGRRRRFRLGWVR